MNKLTWSGFILDVSLRIYHATLLNIALFYRCFSKNLAAGSKQLYWKYTSWWLLLRETNFRGIAEWLFLKDSCEGCSFLKSKCTAWRVCMKVFLVRIQSEFGKIRTRKTPNTDTFHVANDSCTHFTFLTVTSC